jgi:SAM-dependent methyltransferase
MNDDFAKLASHKIHENILAGFLAYRVPKASKAQIFDILDRCAKKKLTTAVALDELGDINARSIDIKKPDRGDSSYSENRINARIRDIEPFEQQLRAAKITQYLDIGCGNGSITAAIGAHLKLTPENIFGADIATWAGHDHKQESLPGFTFKTVDTTLRAVSTSSKDTSLHIASSGYSIDLPSGSIQFISLLMVLHHIKDELLPAVFGEIARLLSPSGLVLLREHDSPNEMVDSLINIEHGVFEVVLEGLTSGDSFGKNYYGKYRTKREWRVLFALYGFSHVGTTKHYGYTRGYYSLFQHNGSLVAPIDAKQTPELIKELQKIGASSSVVKAVRNNDEIKKLIIGGQRELASVSVHI